LAAFDFGSPEVLSRQFSKKRKYTLQLGPTSHKKDQLEIISH
jgi:hypothetical protein